MMSNTPLHPYYFPTTVVLVDDEWDFLSHFSLLLDEQLAFRPFSLPRKALEFINAREPESREYLRDFRRLLDAPLALESVNSVCLDFAGVRRRMYDTERFAQISVAVVDYAMPGMNGLELCQRIEDPRVKTILLTGKADEKTAVKAFNEKLIDRFFRKSAVDVENQVNYAITELQHEYFQTLSDSIQQALAGNALLFLNDPAFRQLFDELWAQNPWVEYFLYEDPQGLMFLDVKGQPSFLFVALEEDLRSHYEIAEIEGAPAELLRTIARRRHIPWFPTQDGYYRSSCMLSWRDYVYPAKRLEGLSQTYYYALQSPSPLPEPQENSIRPYADYLAELDRQISASK